MGGGSADFEGVSGGSTVESLKLKVSGGPEDNGGIATEARRTQRKDLLGQSGNEAVDS